MGFFMISKWTLINSLKVWLMLEAKLGDKSLVRTQNFLEKVTFLTSGTREYQVPVSR